MQKILVIGDSCTDIFIYGICKRLNPEAPVPIISELYRTENRGMSGNVHENLIHLGLDADFITHPEKIIKTRFVEEKSNYILLRFDEDPDIKPISIDDICSIPFKDYEMIIISDYNKGFLKENDIEFILNKSKISLVDTKKPIDEWIKDATFIKINEPEFNSLKNNKKIINNLSDKLIITLGDKGATYCGKFFKSTKEVMVRDVVGAGDTFLAALAGHYLLNKKIEDAIDFANLCASQVVSKKGVAYPNKILL